jgi:hypothetical protein
VPDASGSSVVAAIEFSGPVSHAMAFTRQHAAQVLLSESPNICAVGPHGPGRAAGPCQRNPRSALESADVMIRTAAAGHRCYDWGPQGLPTGQLTLITPSAGRGNGA